MSRNQNKILNFAKIFSSGLFLSTASLQFASAQINPSPMDIKGVKLGMTFDDARTVLESDGYIVRSLPPVSYSVTDNDGTKNIKAIVGEAQQTLMAKKKEGNDVIHMSTSGHPERDEIVVVARMLKYPDEGTKPTWETVANKVEKKYGKVHDFGASKLAKTEFVNNTPMVFRDPYIFYEWNSKGKKRSKLARMAQAKYKEYHEQPECSLTEKGIIPRFGDNLKFSGPMTFLHKAYADRKIVISHVYVNDYIQHSNNASWSRGPGVLRRELTQKSPETVYFSGACRNSFFIRGNINPKTFETYSVTFMMVDHLAIDEDIEALNEWKEEKAKQVEEERFEKVKTIHDAAPDVDL